MSDITKQDLIEATNTQVVMLVVGLVLGALFLALPIIATYPEENTCVMPINNSTENNK